MPRRKRLITLLFILTLLTGGQPIISFAQSRDHATAPSADIADPLTESGRWEWEAPVFTDVFALDASNIFATGKGFWRSTDGGTTWTRAAVFESTPFSAVRFRDANNGYLLGELALVLTTANGGETWVRASGRTNANAQPTARNAVDANAVWYAADEYAIDGLGPVYTGSVVNGSVDGGHTWNASHWVAPITNIIGYNQSAWINYWPDNPDTGCMAGISSTTDGGNTWACGQYQHEGKWVWVLYAAFADDNQGWLAGAFKITNQHALWRSTNGGLNWLLQRRYSEKVAWLVALDGETAWVGLDSHMERTTDGGATWESLPKPPGRPSFISVTRGWTYDATHIYRTTDGGNNWAAVLKAAPKPNTGWFWDHLTGWRAAGNQIERTTDGGDAWLAADPDLTPVDGFQFVDAAYGWAWNNTSLGLRHTGDGGATWSVQQPGADTFKELQFVDPLAGWVTTTGNKLRGTIDGGQTWRDLGSPPMPDPPTAHQDGKHSLGDLAFLNRSEGVAVVSYCWVEGSEESCIGGQTRTHDGGMTWGAIEPGPMGGVYLDGSQNGWGWNASGSPDGTRYEIAHTQDNAAHWIPARTYASWYGPNWLAALDGRQAWNGADDAFYFTPDGGVTWQVQRGEGRPEVAPSVDRLGHVETANGLYYRGTEIGAAHALKPPFIDGSQSDWAGVVPAYSFKAGDVVSIQGSAPAVLDSSMILRAAWDADNLYFAVQVYDDAIRVDSPGKPWEDDSIELGLDGSHDHERRIAPGADRDDRQLTVDANGAVHVYGGSPEGYMAARRTWEKGYVLEVVVPCTALGSGALAAGGLLGFNFALQDDDNGGDRESRLGWLDSGTAQVTAAWGQIRLLTGTAQFEGKGVWLPLLHK